MLHDVRVVAELRAAHLAALREQPGRRPLLWYGHFDWAAHHMAAEGMRGWHGGLVEKSTAG